MFKGTQEPDSGRVTIRGGLTLGMLDQRDPLDDNATVREAALEGREDYEWAAETKSREIVEALLGGISLEAKNRFAFRRSASPRRFGTPVAQGLGYSRTRRAYKPFGCGDHHWLAEHLKNRWPAGSGALLLVTHDRWFLDRVATHILAWEGTDENPANWYWFEGNFQAYQENRIARLGEDAARPHRLHRKLTR